MSYRKSLFVLSFIFGLVLWLVQDASAQWGTGGGISSPRKLGFANLQLFCDLSDPRSTATIDTTPSNLNQTARPSFKFSGKVVCAELLATDMPPPTLADAISFIDNSKAIGLFQLNQITDPALFPGLVYEQSTTGGQTTRTWTFDVTGSDTSFPFAQLLYELVPANLPNTDPLFSLAQQAQKFCNPANLGVTAPPILDPNNCKALFGLRSTLDSDDYGNTLGLQSGEVFTFSTLTKNGVEKALGFAWAPCHTQRFVGPITAVVGAAANNSSMNGDGGTVNQTMGLVIPGVDTGNNLFVTVQPNDLWNAGPLATNPPGRWSNTGGLTQIFSTAAADDSYKTVDPVSGMSYLDKLDSDVADFCTNNPTECPSGIPDQIGTNFGAGPIGDGFQSPYGSLVGLIGTTSYKTLGTHETITVASGQTLKLFYWDLLFPLTGPTDNTGTVNVTIAEDSIQCTADNQPIATQGSVRGEATVQVAYQPTLSVKDNNPTANFPATVIGCSNYNPPFTIQPDGSPIINGTTQARVNGQLVTLTGFHVADTISLPSCDGGNLLPDLKLDLNKKSFIAAVAPGGFCTNGVNSFKLEVGSDANGWVAGTNTIVLNQCK